MLTLLLALFFFIFFVCVHAALFRLKFVRLEPHSIGLLSLLCFVPYGLLLFVKPVLSPETWPLPFSSALIYFGLCLWYTGQCAALENPSPSMMILVQLLKNPEKRVSPSELKEAFSNDRMIKPRLMDLAAFGHASFDGNHFTLTPRGRLIISVIRLYRRLIKRDLGG